MVEGAHSTADCLVETRRVLREKLAKAERWTGTRIRAELVGLCLLLMSCCDLQSCIMPTPGRKAAPAEW